VQNWGCKAKKWGRNCNPYYNTELPLVMVRGPIQPVSLIVTNEEFRVRTGKRSMDDVVSERRLHWLGHSDHQLIPRQTLHWEVPGFKRGPGRPRANWRSTVNKDLLRMGTWEEAEVAAQNRSEWRWSVAQCIHLDAG